ncbi:gastric triacylglycerol lipase-like isoform X1 [Tribolium castaneum]|uniref:Lipase n=2 Tax=Tribolium castaneum TaxID=7070 RepID=A0A139WBZ8_TRICA|nr:Lipase 3-like Protein [Tribolium castaneum]
MSRFRGAFLIFFAIIIETVGFNLNNNACRNYNDYRVRFFSKNCYHNPDVLSDTPSIIHRRGYRLESYTVETGDDYILTIFRIPPLDSSKVNKQPVFLMHGIFKCNADWVDVGNKSLAFNLADRGYDVWLGTIRGCNFAQAHKKLNISDRQYWDFNLDNLAYFDIGQQLRFVAKTTGKWGSIIYLGHSMGTTLGFLYTAGNPGQANELLSGIIALAPVIHLRNVPLVTKLAKIGVPIQRMLSRLRIEGLFYENGTNRLIYHVCATLPHLCKKVLDFFVGNVTLRFRPDDLLLLFSHAPTPTSVQVLRHFLQIVSTGRITRYNYGALKNIKEYGLSEPKSYDLRNIKVPVYLLYGKKDAFVTEQNVQKLFKDLGSRRKFMIQIPKNSSQVPYNHLDFLMAEDMHVLLYPEIFKALDAIRRNSE